MTLYVRKLVSPMGAESVWRMLPLHIAHQKYGDYAQACLIDPMCQGVIPFEQWLQSPDEYGLLETYWRGIRP